MKDSELMEIRGGAIKWAVVGGIASIITFIIGVIDGYQRPFKCNS